MCHIYKGGRPMSAYEIKDWRSHFKENDSDPTTFLKAMLQQEGSSLSERIVDTLNFAITEKHDETVILQLNSKTPILITVQDSEFHIILKTILEYYIENELYEECVLVNNLLNQIINETTKDKSRRKTPITKT